MPLEKVTLDPTTRTIVPFSFPCKNTLYRDHHGNHVLLGRRFPGKAGNGVVLATWAIEALQSLPIPDVQKQVCLEHQEHGWTWYGLLRELPAKESLPSADPSKHGPSNIVIFDKNELDRESWDYVPAPADGIHRFDSQFPRPASFFAPAVPIVVETGTPAHFGPNIPEGVLTSTPMSVVGRDEALDLKQFLRAFGRSGSWLPNVTDLTTMARAGGYTITIDSDGFRAVKRI